MVDTFYDGESFFDLSCLTCAKRWHIKKKSALGKYVIGR